MTAFDLASNTINEFEGCSLVAYQDEGGIWTIAFGHTKNVKQGDTCTIEQAIEWLNEDLQDTLNRVQAQVDVPLNDNQLAALLSFTFNEGAGHLHDSTVLARLNAKDYQGAADALLMWDKCRGVVVNGLLRRRQDERELFLKALVA